VIGSMRSIRRARFGYHSHITSQITILLHWAPSPQVTY